MVFHRRPLCPIPGQDTETELSEDAGVFRKQVPLREDLARMLKTKSPAVATSQGMKPVVVHYGRDLSLLHSRGKVLEAAGFSVSSTQQASEIGSLLGAHIPEMLVLCHSLPLDQREATLQEMRSRWPRMKSLLVAKNSTQVCREPVETVHNSEGLQALVSRVQRLLCV